MRDTRNTFLKLFFLVTLLTVTGGSHTLSAQDAADDPYEEFNISVQKIIQAAENNFENIKGQKISEDEYSTKWKAKINLPQAEESYISKSLIGPITYYGRFWTGTSLKDAQTKYNLANYFMSYCVYQEVVSQDEEDVGDFDSYYYLNDPDNKYSKKLHKLVIHVRITKGSELDENRNLVDMYTVDVGFYLN